MSDLESKHIKENALLREENRLLREKLNLVIRQLFGKKSERLDPAQLELLLSDLEQSDEPGKPKASTAPDELLEAEPRKKRKAGGHRAPRVPEHLPVNETVIEPEEVKAHPSQWRRIGEEVTELLDYKPGCFLRQRTVRPKYVRVDDKEAPPITAPLPPRLIEGGIATAGLLAQITISKYCDHLPLYRQEQIFNQRHGVKIPRQTMVRWIEHVADWLKPIHEEIRLEMFAGGYVQVDEVPVKFLQPGSGKAQQGYLWTYREPGGNTLFDWNAGRGHECIGKIVPFDFEGILQCDGYSAYPAFAKTRAGKIELAACLAHIRRKFYQAYEVGESVQRASWVLRQIQQLYRIESELRESRAGPALRQSVRSSQSRMIIERLHKALYRFKSSKLHLPKSQMGNAIDYALGQWDQLVVFLEHGQVEIDNNLVENAVRPTAIGRKNWLFIGSEEAGWRTAVIYTIIESCRNHGIEPLEYLKEVLTRLPSMTNWQVKELTPAAWSKRMKMETRKAS